MHPSQEPAIASGDLIQQVDDATIQPGQVALWYTGGAGYIVRTPGATIYIDPYCGVSIDTKWVRLIPPPFDPARVRQCDAVLSTHEHLDHCDPHTLLPMRDGTNAPLIGPASSIETAIGFGWPVERSRALSHRESIVVGDMKITAVRSNDPMAKGCFGYVLESGGPTIVNMGDSLWYDAIGTELSPWHVDVICVSVAQNPPNETYYMSEVDAVRIARDVRANVLIPHHWDLWQWVAMDPRRVAAVAPWYAPDTQVRPARFCQRMNLTKVGDAVAVS